MTKTEIVDKLVKFLKDELPEVKVKMFEEAGLLTLDEGLVMTDGFLTTAVLDVIMNNGEKFQITVVKTRG